MKFGRNLVKEETTQKNYQDEDKKSAMNKKIDSWRLIDENLKRMFLTTRIVRVFLDIKKNPESYKDFAFKEINKWKMKKN